MCDLRLRRGSTLEAGGIRHRVPGGEIGETGFEVCEFLSLIRGLFALSLDAFTEVIEADGNDGDEARDA